MEVGATVVQPTMNVRFTVCVQYCSLGGEQNPVRFRRRKWIGKKHVDHRKVRVSPTVVLPIFLALNVPCIDDIRRFANSIYIGKSTCFQFGDLLSITYPCAKHSYRVTETLPRGSPSHLKPRQVTRGTAVIVDGRAVSHEIPGLSPGKVRQLLTQIIRPKSHIP